MYLLSFSHRTVWADAAARIYSSIAEPVMIRNAHPPLASTICYARPAHRSRLEPPPEVNFLDDMVRWRPAVRVRCLGRAQLQKVVIPLTGAKSPLSVRRK